MDQRIDGVGQVDLGACFPTMVRQETLELMTQLVKNSRPESPHIHGDNFIACKGCDKPVRAGIPGESLVAAEAIFGPVSFNASQLYDLVKKPVGVDFANAAGHRAKVGERIA